MSDVKSYITPLHESLQSSIIAEVIDSKTLVLKWLIDLFDRKNKGKMVVKV
ncbi:MAG TPA: hypothetical protein VFM79_13585 [Pelobium sp.]|nr:hypothetical protein [Pelobium sp.]